MRWINQCSLANQHPMRFFFWESFQGIGQNEEQTLLTSLQRGDAHGGLPQSRLPLPLALIRMIYFHGGQWALLCIHASHDHELVSGGHGGCPGPSGGERGQLAPALALQIQHLGGVQREAVLAAAPQHIEAPGPEHRRAVHPLRGHGGEHLPVQRLHRAQSHLGDGHGSRTAHWQQSMTQAQRGGQRNVKIKANASTERQAREQERLQLSVCQRPQF